MFTRSQESFLESAATANGSVPRLTLCVRAALLLGVLAIVVGGIWLRRWAWDQTRDARAAADIRNAYRWGQAASEPGVGYLNLYARTEPDARTNALWQLDYPPLRLLIITQWVQWTQRHFPEARSWRSDYAFSSPLLTINCAMELVSAVSVFVLVAFWLRPSSDSDPLRRLSMSSLFRLSGATLTRASLASLLFWINPAILWDAHCWPQWDVWLVPFFLLAVLAASMHRWAVAGVCVAIGALLKGQMLLVLPFFILWPLIDGKPRNMARFVVGFLAAGLSAVLPWLIQSPTSESWSASPWAVGWVLLCLLLALTFYPWPGNAGRWLPARCFGWRSLPLRHLTLWLAGAWVIALLVWVLLIGGNMVWLRVGYAYGIRHYMRMHIGSTPNLAAILHLRLGWSRPDEVLWELGALTISVRTLLVTLYTLGLALCAIGAARHSRDRDPRFLAAVSSPWVLMFALLPQMHERYLVFAAGISAMLAAVGVLPCIMHLVLTALSWNAMLQALPKEGLPPWLRDVSLFYPDSGWFVLGASVVLLWYALTPSRRVLTVPLTEGH